MLKQFLLIFTFAFTSSSFVFTQEKPQKDTLKDQQQVKVNNTQTEEGKEEPLLKTSWNKVCPVMGNKVDPEGPTVEYNGKIYGFCCPGCDAKFEKNPEKYARNLNEDGTRFIGRK